MTSWLFICNLKDYDLDGCFKENDNVVYWHYNRTVQNIEVGDIVYFYLSNPDGYIKYKGVIEAIHTPAIDDDKFNRNKDAQYLKSETEDFIKIRAVTEYLHKNLTASYLKEHGHKCFMWPCKINPLLADELFKF